MSENKKRPQQFEPGHAGRPTGTRNRLTGNLLKALADDFAIGGAAAIKIMRMEEPAAYVKVLVSILPKEMLIEQGAFSDMSDEDIVAVLDTIRKMKARVPVAEESAETKTIN